MTHICVGKLTIIGSDNGLSPGRRQAIIWTIAGILLIGPLWTDFIEILIRIQTFSFQENAFENGICEMASICLGLYVLSPTMNLIFTRGQFWPSGIVVACVCLSVCPSVRLSVCVCGKHLLVCTITHHPFKLGSLNLDHRCKRPWLRSLLFWGWLTLTFKVKFQLQNQNLSHFELFHAMTLHQLKLQFPNLEQKCILALFRSLPILGLIKIDLQFNF